MIKADQLYKELDNMFASHASAQEIEKYLLNALNQSQEEALKETQNKESKEKANCAYDKSQEANAQALQLSVLNELMGFYRSRGEHAKNQPIINRALNIANEMQLSGTEAGTTTLINAATSLRAAGDYDRAEEIYSQALKESSKTLKPNDRKLAALHNNLSMLYSETGKIKEAIDQLEKALNILQKSSVNPSTDIDIAATHTNIALAILQECSQPNANTNNKSATLNSAFEHAQMSLKIYKDGNNQNQPHYASALAGYAQVQYARKEYSDAVKAYSEALDLIAQCYGKDSESYAITLENLQQAQDAAEKFTATSEALSLIHI